MTEEQTIDTGAPSTVELTQEELVAQATRDPKESLEQFAVLKFQTGIQQFRKKIKEMSANQLRRAWMAAIEYPLHDKPPEFSYDIEASAALLAQAVDESKFALLLLGVEKYGAVMNKSPTEKALEENPVDLQTASEDNVLNPEAAPLQKEASNGETL